jgi:hypothetical protein
MPSVKTVPQPTMACSDQRSIDELYLLPANRAIDPAPTTATPINRRWRLLCPAGCGLQRVSVIQRRPSTVFSLSCGHTRGDVLPANGISFEHINSPECKRLFPPDLVSQRIRDKYPR